MSKFCQVYYCCTSGKSSKFQKNFSKPNSICLKHQRLKISQHYFTNFWVSICKEGGIQILGRFSYQRPTFLSKMPLQILETLNVFQFTRTVGNSRVYEDQRI